MINLPAQIRSGNNTVKANYTYLSDGSKAAALNASGAGYDYAGSFTYSHASNGTKTLESVAFGGGRIRKTGSSSYAVDYYITDLLGSVRAIVNAAGTIQEQNDYYPFGTRHPNGLTTLPANRWRYNGKEDQVTGSLGYIDYGARLFDPDIARWNAVDPLSDKQNDFSPYSFCGGNPVLHIDDDGQIFETAWDAASLVMGVKSFVSNIKHGNVGGAIVDGLGIIADAAAVATPFIPGGVSAGISALRIGKNVDHAVDAAKAIDRTLDATKKINQASDVSKAANKSARNVEKAINGETKHTVIGKKAHKEFNPGSEFIKEYPLPSGKKADAVNETKGIVIELKPNNPRAIKRGE